MQLDGGKSSATAATSTIKPSHPFTHGMFSMNSFSCSSHVPECTAKTHST